MSVTFPNETADYRNQRDKLLTAEVELRAQIEHVATLRRALPEGGEVPQDYTFHRADGAPIQMSDLFKRGHDTLAVYSLMYRDDATAPCPMCVAFLDALNGQIRHVTQNLSVVVVAAATAPKLAGLVADRGWHDLPIYSAAGTSYQSDYNAETQDGSQLPIMNIFERKQGLIRHFWGSEMFFAPTEGTHPRHVDALWPLWNVLDLTRDGRGDFMPRLSYT